jgi:hypothetical protein
MDSFGAGTAAWNFWFLVPTFVLLLASFVVDHFSNGLTMPFGIAAFAWPIYAVGRSFSLWLHDMRAAFKDAFFRKTDG